jgi:hypothetical protein
MVRTETRRAVLLAAALATALAAGAPRAEEPAEAADGPGAEASPSSSATPEPEDRPAEIRRTLARIEEALQLAGARPVAAGGNGREQERRIGAEGYTLVAVVSEDGAWESIRVGYTKQSKMAVIVVSGRDPESFRRTGTFITVETTSAAVLGPDGRTDLARVEEYMKKNVYAHLTLL